MSGRNCCPSHPSALARVRECRLNHATLLVGRKIVIHGGWDGSSSTMNDLWVFDTDSFAWLQPRVGGLAPSPRCVIKHI